MKFKILLFIVLCYNLGNAQLEKAEVYTTGTKITYYIGQCNNDIPEAQNKISFCDSNDNLGVVERSFGLNDHAIKRIVPNYYNNDEVFLTWNGGFSIRKTIGEWDNIPNVAIPRGGNGNSASLEFAVINHQGKLLMSNGQRPGVTIYDIPTKTFDYFSYGDTGTNYFYYTSDVAHDSVNGVTYVLAKRGGQNKFNIYKYENDTLSFVNSIDSEISPSSIITTQSKMYYKNDKLYIGTTAGLYVFNANDASLDHIYISDNSTYVTSVKDIAEDNSGNIWVACNTSNNGALYKININNDAITTYQLPSNTNVNYKFNSLAVHNDGTVYAQASNLSGIVALDASNPDPVWEITSMQDFDDLGLPMMGSIGNISKDNNKIYFTKTSHTFSSEQGKLEAFVLNDQNQWSGVTDNEPTNISRKALGTKDHAFPSANGMWFHDSGTLTHMDSDDNFKRFFNPEIDNSYSLTVDQDANPIIGVSSLKKFYSPFIFEIDPVTGSQIRFEKYKDQIWMYNKNNQLIKVYRNNEVINTINLPNEFSDYSLFSPGTNDDAYFARRSSGIFYLKTFDMISQSITTLTAPDIGPVRQIVPLPSGNIAILCWDGIFLYDGQELQAFTNEDFNFTSVMRIHEGVANTDGHLFILSKETRRIYIIKDIELGSPDFSSVSFQQYSNTLPFHGFHALETISLDHQGHIWLQGAQKLTKLTTDNTSPQFINDGVSYGITGLVYIDLNENDQFDEGEAYKNQKVTIRTPNKTLETFTDKDGNYFFPYFEGAASYEITLPNLSPLVICEDRQREVAPASLEQNTTLSNFKLLQKNVGSLLVKSADKEGAWAFSRTGFENTYTTAIGNISFVKTFSDVNLTYAFYNDENNLGDELPDIEDVKVYKLEPSSNLHLIEHISINPRNHHWNLNLPPTDFSQSIVDTSPTVTKMTDSTFIDINIGDINPLDTFIIEIESDLFNPEDFNNVVVHTVTKIESSDFGDGTGPTTVFLVPIDPAEPIGFPPLAGPYKSPEEVYSEPPYTDPKDVYSNGPFQSLIQSSYDPNDKLTNPGLPEGINEIPLNQKWITYTIRFQNEGNFSAKDVYLVDELDPKLDPFSLIPLESSHSYTVESISRDDQHLVKFNFNDIFLDYQANDEEGSQGHISFMIKVKDNVSLGDIIINNAEIYFDQNPPIITNLVQHEFIEEALSTSEIINSEVNLKLWPNPAQNKLNIEYRQASNYQLSIYDINGRKLMTQKSSSRHKVIDISTLHEGIYFLKVFTEDDNQQSIKFIKN